MYLYNLHFSQFFCEISYMSSFVLSLSTPKVFVFLLTLNLPSRCQLRLHTVPESRVLDARPSNYELELFRTELPTLSLGVKVYEFPDGQKHFLDMFVYRNPVWFLNPKLSSFLFLHRLL